MPQTWQTHWNPEPRLTPDQAAERDQRIQTLGNLTLIAKCLNGALSNRPWTDTEASSLTAGGDAGLGKRSLLAKYSLLVLSKDLINEHPDAWTDADIEDRAAKMSRYIMRGSYYWQNDNDLTLDVRSAYDKEYLYFNIFVRDFAISGGLLLLVGMGPGPFAIDNQPKGGKKR